MAICDGPIPPKFTPIPARVRDINKGVYTTSSPWSVRCGECKRVIEKDTKFVYWYIDHHEFIMCSACALKLVMNLDSIPLNFNSFSGGMNI